MAKSDTPFTQIDVSPTGKQIRKPKWAIDRPINGFDTETAEGGVFMVSRAFEGNEPDVITDYPDLLNPAQLWRSIITKKARQAINVWFNMTFDIDTILSNILNNNLVHELRVTNRLDFSEREPPIPEMDGYEILYVKDKFFYVSDEHGHSWKHYDVAQFTFGMDLEQSANQLLGESKKDEDIDVKQFGSVKGKVNQYIRDLWEKIKEYAKVDAKLVRDIYKKLVNVGEQELQGNRIPMGVPISTGALAESYMEYHFQKPAFSVKDMQGLGWKAFHGGRFEALCRGNVGKVVIPDINSAYPDKLRNLPNPSSLYWERFDNPDETKIRNSDYGFVTINVTTNDNKPIQPFAYKTDKVMFPALEDTTITVVKDLFVHALDNGLIDAYEVENSWLAWETDTTHFPFSAIPEIYEQRQYYKQNDMFIQEMLLKIVLNSMFGKTCQTTEKRYRIKEDEMVDLQDVKNMFVRVISTQLSMLKDNVFPNGIKVEQVSGRWFNPFLASYITGLTRMQLIDALYRYGLEYDTMALATDSIMVDYDAFKQTDFEGDLVEPGTLGKWDIEAIGDGFIVGTGVYQIDKEQGGTKLGNRGFAEMKELKPLIERSKDDKVMIENPRPLKLGEVDTTLDRTLKDVGVFVKDERELNANMDTMRNWNSIDTFQTLLEGKTRSEPLKVVDGKLI